MLFSFALVSSILFAALLKVADAKDDRMELCPVNRKDGSQTQYMVKKDEAFTEVSYIAFSEQKYDGNPVIWMGSDGSNDSISAVDLDSGKIIQTYELSAKTSGDWESISLGPCTSKRKKICLYMGATGNNAAQKCDDQDCTKGREEVNIYKMEEPDVSDNVRKAMPVVTIVLDYDRNKLPTNRADCEAMFVDHTGDDEDGEPGDIYLVTKFPNDEDLGRIVKVPVREHENVDWGDEVKYSVQMVGKPYEDMAWTGADMSLDGSMIALRGYRKILFFPRSSSQTVADALEDEPCEYESYSEFGEDEQQFEAVSMVEDDVCEASECDKARECRVAVTCHKLKYSD